MSGGALRILTLNAGLLEIRLLGRTLLEVPHVTARLQVLPEALGATGADVICLQEVFRPAHRDLLVSALSVTHPYAVRRDDRRRGLTHGLLVLSRYPLRGEAFTPFTAQEALQGLFVRQGVLAATVAVPGAGDVRILNLHTTAGGRAGSEATRTERLRMRQLDQASAAGLKSGFPTLLCGDLNAGPEASAGNYRRLLEQGWRDAGPTGPSWDPANSLNRGGFFRASPPQRIDHVLLDPKAADLLVVRSRAVVLDEAIVDVPGGPVTPSDHAGVLVQVERG